MVHLSELNQKLLERHNTLNLERDILKAIRTLQVKPVLIVKKKKTTKTKQKQKNQEPDTLGDAILCS